MGWDGDLETEFAEPAATTTATETVRAGDSSFDEELIEDRYAALQAWSEWTESQERAGRPRCRGRGLPRRDVRPSRFAEPDVRRTERPARAAARPGRGRRRASGPSLSTNSRLQPALHPAPSIKTAMTRARSRPPSRPIRR